MAAPCGPICRFDDPDRGHDAGLNRRICAHPTIAPDLDPAAAHPHNRIRTRNDRLRRMTMCSNRRTDCRAGQLRATERLFWTWACHRRAIFFGREIRHVHHHGHRDGSRVAAGPSRNRRAGRDRATIANRDPPRHLHPATAAFGPRDFVRPPNPHGAVSHARREEAEEVGLWRASPL